MATKTIKVLINRENNPDQERLKRYEDLKAFCEEKGFQYLESFEFDTAYNENYLWLNINDRYYSDEMREVIEYCQNNSLERGEFISKHSKNILDAYIRAEEEYKELRASFQNVRMTKEKTDELMNLRGYLSYLQGKIVKKVLEGYKK